MRKIFGKIIDSAMFFSNDVEKTGGLASIISNNDDKNEVRYVNSHHGNRKLPRSSKMRGDIKGVSFCPVCKNDVNECDRLMICKC